MLSVVCCQQVTVAYSFKVDRRRGLAMSCEATPKSSVESKTRNNLLFSASFSVLEASLVRVAEDIDNSSNSGN